MLIHKKLAPMHRISWRAIEPGRIVHVKIYGDGYQTNIIGVYQQAWQPSNTQGCTLRRRELLRKLEVLLQECSCNQSLIMGGDFNTEVCRCKGHIGCSKPNTGVEATPKQPDWQEFHDLIRRRGLCLVSTFQAWRPTYAGAGPEGETVRTRIDPSRQCVYISDYILSAHRRNALCCSFRAKWTPWNSTNQSQDFTAQHRLQLLRVQTEYPQEWQQWQSHMHAKLARIQDPSELASTLNEGTRSFLKAHPPCPESP